MSLKPEPQRNSNKNKEALGQLKLLDAYLDQLFQPLLKSTEPLALAFNPRKKSKTLKMGILQAFL